VDVVSALCWAIAAEVLVVIVRFKEGTFAVVDVIAVAQLLLEGWCVVVDDVDRDEEASVSWGRLARSGSIAIEGVDRVSRGEMVAAMLCCSFCSVKRENVSEM
jgi:hypothetical protein